MSSFYKNALLSAILYLIPTYNMSLEQESVNEMSNKTIETTLNIDDVIEKREKRDYARKNGIPYLINQKEVDYGLISTYQKGDTLLTIEKNYESAFEVHEYKVQNELLKKITYSPNDTLIQIKGRKPILRRNNGEIYTFGEN